MWGPCHPFGNEQAQNAIVFRVLSARSYSDDVHISISWITTSCPANIVRSSQETVLWQCLKHKSWFRREGARRNDHTMNRLSCTRSCHKVWVDMVSDGLRSTPHGVNFMGSMLEECALYMRDKCVLRVHSKLSGRIASGGQWRNLQSRLKHFARQKIYFYCYEYSYDIFIVNFMIFI